jgi:hypothetical protein
MLAQLHNGPFVFKSGETDSGNRPRSASAKSSKHPARSVSCKGGKSVLLMETLWKNNLNFVKNVGLPTIYVNVIITVIIVSEKKK